MIEPLISLAFSIHSSPGLYALLLGSGVSRSSGIPTGWEIVLDLIGRLARVQGGQSIEDPVSWYRSKTGVDPDYSRILAEVAPSSADRMNLLRKYIEPDADDAEHGRKTPSQAHRAVARLVAGGWVRVIVTTNFDRLLEVALVDAGIQPKVISTPSEAAGALPLAHSRCTILKVNGDYIDTGLRNTTGELAAYDPAIEKLLDQVFDEYGLIVCGWSARWDAALRTAIQRCPNRRFSTYWTRYTDLDDQSLALVNHRGAVVVPIAGADAFFDEFAERIEALDSFSQPPLTAKIAVERMKKYLADPVHRIRLHDLVHCETERALDALAKVESNPVPESIDGRFSGYEAALNTLSSALVCGTYWAEPEQEDLLMSSFKRLATRQEAVAAKSTYIGYRYPSLLLVYALGMTSICRDKYHFLRTLLSANLSAEQTVVASAALALQAVASTSDHRTPVNDRLFERLRPVLYEYLPSDSDYEATFNWFEYVLGLAWGDQRRTHREWIAEMEKCPGFEVFGPVGRFGWNCAWGRHSIQDETELVAGQPYPQKVARLLESGFFESGGSVAADSKYRLIKVGYDRYVYYVRKQWGCDH